MNDIFSQFCTSEKLYELTTLNVSPITKLYHMKVLCPLESGFNEFQKKNNNLKGRKHVENCFPYVAYYHSQSF